MSFSFEKLVEIVAKPFIRAPKLYLTTAVVK
jgi:hypothetical protein